MARVGIGIAAHGGSALDLEFLGFVWSGLT